MSTREEKTGLVEPRAAEVFDDDIDLLQALQFAQDDPVTPITAPSSDNVVSPAWPDPKTQVPQRDSHAEIERRLATLRGFKEIATRGDAVPTERPLIDRATSEKESRRVRDSLITVPPAITSLPPISLPPLPALRVPQITVENTAPSAPITPAFAAAITTRTKGSVGRLTWAVLMTTIGIALPGGLLLGRALTSRADAAGRAQLATSASTAPPPAPEASALAAPLASATEAPSSPDPPAMSAAPSAHVLSYPVDWSLLVRAPRPVHHAKAKAAPKPAASAASADTTPKTAASNSPRTTDAPAPVDSSGTTPP